MAGTDNEASTKPSKKNKKTETKRKKYELTKQINPTPTYNNSHLPSATHLKQLRKYISFAHVQSFDYFLSEGLHKGIEDIEHYHMDLISSTEDVGGLNNVKSLEFWIEGLHLGHPQHTASSVKSEGGGGSGGGAGGRFSNRVSSGSGSLNSSNDASPRQCRELGTTYGAPLSIDICYRVHDKTRLPNKNRIFESKRISSTARVPITLGLLPIMVGSNKCVLAGKTSEELIGMKEEGLEFGGYFITNGIERCIRILQVPKRNHPMAIQRSSFKNRGMLYTDYGVAIRCGNVNQDMETVTNTLHYLTSGCVTFKVLVYKQEKLIPVILILRALGNGLTDEELYTRMTSSERSTKKNKLLSSRVLLLLQDFCVSYPHLSTEISCLTFLGNVFRNLLRCSPTTSDLTIGKLFLKRFACIHLSHNSDKQECIIQMLRKLFAVVSGECAVDNQDSFSNHELLVTGHLFSMILKDEFRRMLENLVIGFGTEARKEGYSNRQKSATLVDRIDIPSEMNKLVTRYCAKESFMSRVRKILSTGNLESKTGLDLMQISGFSVVAERLNFWRFISHFRAVHRGAFFTTMKTTTVRKLLPDSWGFLCPVHTPDGTPCGLLNHMAIGCRVVGKLPVKDMVGESKTLENLLFELGVDSAFQHMVDDPDKVCVWLDGKVVGYTLFPSRIVDALRAMKVDRKIPHTLEIAHIPIDANHHNPYPGIYLFLSPGRVLRPVIHRASGKVELIGAMSQPFMDIACLSSDVEAGRTTHQELNPTNMLDLLSNFTPFSDYNQSPRNMYQCQMGKQTMGTPAHALPHRADNKLYKVTNVEAPLVSTKLYRDFGMDEYPNGCNAVVAVLSYTGFDMEDSVVINKASYDRGFGHASVYKTIVVELSEVVQDHSSESRYRFGNSRPEGKERNNLEIVNKGMPLYDQLDADGLPEAGTWMNEGDVLYCIIDELSGEAKVTKYKEKERACVQTVRLIQSNPTTNKLTKVSIMLRIPRNPVVGDKFSSRHGQKGIMSTFWEQENMPFSESGICPDLIINPHAFPSRMTIGMMIESMAAKAGALHGVFQDATPFSFHESGKQLAIDYFGEQLQAAGYSYYGSEPLYSGTSGNLLQADLYIGVVYYQRLRHMVMDKFQVRATGPINQLTKQPVKGRKRGGGIRLGEMERDSLISHGVAFCMYDRLLASSDGFLCNVCTKCGDLLLPTSERCTILSAGQSQADAKNNARLRLYCRCQKDDDSSNNDDAANNSSIDSPYIEPIILPYVYWYLTNELAAMNISMKMEFK